MLPPRRTTRSYLLPVTVLLTVLILSGSSPATGSALNARNTTAWVWPVAAPHPVVQPFVAPTTAYSAGHRGIDIAASLDAEVRAPASGIVHFSGFVVNRNLISIDHGGGVLSSFEPVLSDLADGTAVRRGQLIGVLQSGHCKTSCLHFGVRLFGQYVSPMNYLGGIAHSVLLPTRPLP